MFVRLQSDRVGNGSFRRRYRANAALESNRWHDISALLARRLGVALPSCPVNAG